MTKKGTPRGEGSDSIFDDFSRAEEPMHHLRRTLKKEIGSDVQSYYLREFLRGRDQHGRHQLSSNDDEFASSIQSSPDEFQERITSSLGKSSTNGNGFDFSSWSLMMILGVAVAAFALRYKQKSKRRVVSEYERARFKDNDLDVLSADW